MNKILRTLIYCSLILFTIQTEANDETPVVAVAANFSSAFTDIVNEFTLSTGRKVKVSVGSSGALVRQIELGAPFELFLSADEEYVEELYKRGLSLDKGRNYATGKLVLFISNSSHMDKNLNIQDILRHVVSDDTYRIAIANPDLAPYGRAARQVLNRFTNIHMLNKRIIPGENVGQTAQFVLTGSVDIAFLPYSLAISRQLQDAGYYELIPVDWYKPIHQRMALLKNAGETAQALYKYMSSENAQQIILQYGYSLPLN